MTIRQKLVVPNIAAVVGLLISLFIVPGDTPLWLWGVIAVVVIGILNVCLILKRQRARRDSPVTVRTAIIALGAALLLMDVILSRYFR